MTTVFIPQDDSEGENGAETASNDQPTITPHVGTVDAQESVQGGSEEVQRSQVAEDDGSES